MFQTQYGLFEYRVMPFGLSNTPVVFQFMVVYLDDILIYSLDLDTHEQHVCMVLSRLREHVLYAKYEKCTFEQSSVESLGYIIPPDGISMDQRKVAAIQEWKPPTRVRDIQSFLGFAKILSSVY